MRRQVQPAEILGATAQALRDSMYHCAPGIVLAYYGAEQAADVQPATHDVRIDPDTQERVSEPWPILPKVRVLFPKFSGLAVWGDLSPGDKVLLIALDLDPTKHRASGQAEDPIDTRRHGGAYWVAIPGDLTDAGTLPSTGAGKVFVGGGADAAALASVLDAFIKVFLNWTPMPNDGGAALHTALMAWATGPPAFSTTGSGTVKVSK